MVQAETLTATFIGAKTGRKYSALIFLSDVAAVPGKWSITAAPTANSDTYWRPPENVILTDVALPTGLTATVALNWYADGALINAGIVFLANHLNTMPFRPQLTLAFPAGCQISAVQV